MGHASKASPPDKVEWNKNPNYVLGVWRAETSQRDSQHDYALLFPPWRTFSYGVGQIILLSSKNGRRIISIQRTPSNFEGKHSKQA